MALCGPALIVVPFGGPTPEAALCPRLSQAEIVYQWFYWSRAPGMALPYCFTGHCAVQSLHGGPAHGRFLPTLCGFPEHPLKSWWRLPCPHRFSEHSTH